MFLMFTGNIFHKIEKKKKKKSHKGLLKQPPGTVPGQNRPAVQTTPETHTPDHRGRHRCTAGVTSDDEDYDDDILEFFLNKVTEPLPEKNVTVVNLSKYHLSDSELSLLERGLNFCPTPGEPDMGQLRRDLDSFHRKLRLKSFFETPTGVGIDHTQNNFSAPDPNRQSSELEESIKFSRVIKKSKEWTPPMGPLHLESFCLNNERDLNKTKVQAPHLHNISRKEKKALKDLGKNTKVVVKGADKGGATVILNREDYVQEGSRQLSDETFYQKLRSDPTEDNNFRINSFIEGLHKGGEITKSLRNKLLTIETRTPELYLLPKIHKPQRPPPGRPVVSANGCPTEKISALVDIFLKPHLPHIRSYLKDTTDFIKKLESLPKLEQNSLLCTLDMSSLYTNIPNLEGKRAVARSLIKHRQHNGGPEPSNTSICRMLDMVLTMNVFRFNGEVFLQRSGTAMGTRVAPTYANIFMSDFEDRFVYTYHKQPRLWLRFIDDIFFIWEHGELELQNFLDYLNGVHPTIKFTSEHSSEKVNFLDVWAVKREDGYLITDLYSKPTDSNNYLHYRSAHPSHCKRGIPFGQFLRLGRICTERESFVRHAIEKGKHFLRRRFPKEMIAQAFAKALKTNRRSLIDQPRDPNKEETPNILVTTFSPNQNILKEIVTENWDILGRSCSTRATFEKRLLTAYRRPKNLRDLLVRARLPRPRPEEEEANKGDQNPSNPCLTKKCRYCPRINTSGRIKCSYTGREYVAKHNVTCKSSNLIYCLTCKKCDIQYVGQTKNRLMDRFPAHFYNIGHNRPNSEIGKHFNQADHNGLDDVEIHIVDFIHAHPAGNKAKYLRDLVEFNWVQRMHSNAPQGLNSMDPRIA